MGHLTHRSLAWWYNNEINALRVEEIVEEGNE